MIGTSATALTPSSQYSNVFDICLWGETAPLATIEALSATEAYDFYVEQEFGNGCCGYDVDVYCHATGIIVEF